MKPIPLRVQVIMSSVRNQARGLDPALYCAFLETLRGELAREAARADEPDEQDFEKFKAKLDEESE